MTKEWKKMNLSDCANIKGGVTLAATMTEINSVCDDNTATAAEIVRAADVSGRIVTAITTLAVTEALHEGKIILLSLLAGFTATLPAATGSGGKYTFKVGIVNTSNAYIVAALGTDTMSGFVFTVKDDIAAMPGFVVGGTDDKLSLNGTTTGGLTIGDTIVCVDAQSTRWHVEVFTTSSGTEATPASAS